jgi:hypothetical protein
MDNPDNGILEGHRDDRVRQKLEGGHVVDGILERDPV